MKVEQILNGLDVEEMKGLLGKMKENPELAKFRFRAKNEWVNGSCCRTTIQGFYGLGAEEKREGPFELTADEPKPLLGTDKGPSATEALLYALASCLNTTFICHAASEGVTIEKLEMDLEGNIDLRGFLGLSDEVRNGYSDIHVTIRVESDAPREKLEHLCQLAQERSPVFDIVTHEVPVTVVLEH